MSSRRVKSFVCGGWSFLRLILCILIISTCSCADDGAANKMKEVSVKETLTVLTYNLWHGLNPVGLVKFQEYETPEERENRLQGFLEQAREINPDIVFLQEVNPAPGLTARLARELGCDGAFLIDNAGIKIGSVGLPTNFRSGLAILAKKDLRLKDLGGKKLSGVFGWTSRYSCFHLGEFRCVMAASVIVNGAPILLMNTHLHHGPEVTRETVAAVDAMTAEHLISASRGKEILDTIDGASTRRKGELESALAFASSLGFEGKPILFAGDFNASPDAAELNWLRGIKGFASATWDGNAEKPFYTWDWERNPNTHFIADFVPVNTFEKPVTERLNKLEIGLSRRLDYLFYRAQGMMSVESSGLFGDLAVRGKMSSDHFGVQARFRIERAP